MGNYLELYVNVKLIKELPQEVVDFLNEKIVLNNWVSDEAGLNHRLFKCQRWSSIFAHSGFHEPPEFYRFPNGYYKLILHGEINNGMDEVYLFKDWIYPYVAGRKSKQYIGYWDNETPEVPKENIYIERPYIEDYYITHYLDDIKNN